MKVTSTRVIASAPEPIWDILTTATEYAELEPRLVSVSGEFAPYELLTVVAQFSNGPNRRIGVRVRIVEFEPGRRMVWASRRWFSWLLRGTRTFTLMPRGPELTEVAVSEEFEGLLLPLVAGQRAGLSEALDELTANLKKRVEPGAGNGCPRP